MCEKVGGLPGREPRRIMLLFAGHRQGVGQVSKTSTGRFNSYGLRKKTESESRVIPLWLSLEGLS